MSFEDVIVANGFVRVDVLKYDLCTLADQMKEALEAAEGALRLEQAVYGLDSKNEIEIQDLLADAFSARYEVAREVHYPASKGAKRTHRMRCDLVLSPKGQPLQSDVAPPTLFDPLKQAEAGDALWLEVKVAYQFREGGRRHGGYGAQWRTAVVEDLKKMEQDALIQEAALVLVVFNESAAVIEKDLDLFETVLMEKEVLAGFRHVRTISILDRIGHRLCTLAVWPTVQKG